MHTLIVDDSAVIRKKIVEALTAAGHTCDEAENGLVAIKMVLTNSYDLVVTDLMMPVLDGLKFLHRLRATERTRHVPVLILSSRGDEDAVLTAKRLGVQGYLLKPVQPDTLLERIARLPRPPAD